MKKIDSVYFLGVGGTGMGSVAGLVKQSGRQVFGSDQNLYPPMSDILAEANIEVFTPYSQLNIEQNPADLYVIGNSMSVGKNEELEQIMANDLPYTSFPALLNQLFLQDHVPCVVTGTHGKTTTSSLLAHCMTELKLPTSFFIGGRPLNFDLGYGLCDQDKEQKFFVLEGDEYDTAFFDKNSKFLHYAPQVLLLQNIEFDHADIFNSLDDIFVQFEKVLNLVPNPENIVACSTDPNVEKILKKLKLQDKCTRTGADENCSIRLTGSRPSKSGQDFWTHSFATPWGELDIECILGGEHGSSNIGQVLGALTRLQEISGTRWEKEKILQAFKSFLGVARRLDLLAEQKDIKVIEDFAHHPTAIDKVLRAYKEANPGRRLWVAFEARSATSRRNIFTDAFAESLGHADKILVGPALEDKKLADTERMDTTLLAKKIGSHARSCDEHRSLKDILRKEIKAGDTVIFMSCGSFGGIQHEIAEFVKEL